MTEQTFNRFASAGALANDKAQRLIDAHALVDAWNAKFPIGTPVQVLLDDGTTRMTKSRSAATMFSGVIAAIWLEGISGCYALRRCSPMPSEQQPSSLPPLPSV